MLKQLSVLVSVAGLWSGGVFFKHVFPEEFFYFHAMLSYNTHRTGNKIFASHIFCDYNSVCLLCNGEERW